MLLFKRVDTPGSKKMTSVRVFASCVKWNPDATQWMKAMSLVQVEERKRIDKFVFKKDAKSAMVVLNFLFCVFMLCYANIIKIIIIKCIIILIMFNANVY